MDATRVIEEEYREDREFMIAWVHEVKMPITAARLLLESGKYDGETLGEEIERISESVEKVLYYSRSDSFSQDYIIAEEDLNALVRENVKKHSALFIKKQIRVSLEVPAGLSVFTDRKWLLFIMDQLLSNALKYTEEKGAIQITAQRNGMETVLSYNDNGRGIKKEDMPRLFAKSFTGQNGRGPGSTATGLGLYLAQKLARKLNHSISISSEYGSGTSASIHFPILEDKLTII
jgi:signal transduction histidine kinase